MTLEELLADIEKWNLESGLCGKGNTLLRCKLG